MKKALFLSISYIIFSLISRAGENDGKQYYYQNVVYREEIKTVQLYRLGNELSNPVIELNGDAQLVLKFDDLAGASKNFYYTIVHCDADWNESHLNQSEYIEGFPDNQISDYAMSFNTTMQYVNYQLVLPNDDVQFKYSGNYALVVFEDNDKSKLVLTRRFYVTEPLTTIDGLVKKATFDPYLGANQEVDFSVNLNKLRVPNPAEDIKVVLSQNRRWDNAIRNLKPLYINGQVLSYDYNKENVFHAGNEFRYFDLRSNRHPGENIDRIDFHRPYYHATLAKDEIRCNKKFFPYKEMNGKFVIESQDRVQDYDTECDYSFVHFTLPLPTQLPGGSANVFGELTGWTANKSNEMTWNAKTASYELTMLLKQGYYNYEYVYVPAGVNVADATNLEGSHFETENDYQIFVYFRDRSTRYDRLIGFTQINSAQKL